MNNISKWATIEYQGQRGEILAVDSDPRASVMIKLHSNPDKALFVPRSALTVIAQH
jgi:hypothetical protein